MKAKVNHRQRVNENLRQKGNPLRGGKVNRLQRVKNFHLQRESHRLESL